MLISCITPKREEVSGKSDTHVAICSALMLKNRLICSAELCSRMFSVKMGLSSCTWGAGPHLLSFSEIGAIMAVFFYFKMTVFLWYVSSCTGIHGVASGIYEVTSGIYAVTSGIHGVTSDVLTSLWQVFNLLKAKAKLLDTICSKLSVTICNLILSFSMILIPLKNNSCIVFFLTSMNPSIFSMKPFALEWSWIAVKLQVIKFCCSLIQTLVESVDSN